MDWEKLTSADFADAVRMSQGVCLLPMGVVEKHGEHLPLGTDYLSVREMVRRVAELEPAVVFPPFFFGQCHESKNAPGAIALGRDTLLAALDGVCSEIARNGLTKIVMVNGHGGNEPLLSFYSFTQMDRPKPYTVYIVRLTNYYCVEDPRWKAMKEGTAGDWHSGEAETSVMLELFPELVHMDRVPSDAPGERTQRLAHLPGHSVGVWWPAEFPAQYAGDARVATPEKGRFLVGEAVKRLAAIVRCVKDDTETRKAEDDFFRQAGQRP